MSNTGKPIRQMAIDIRVRYNECDPMRVAHHGVYPTWLELARCELLRARGFAYSALELRGIFFVVAHLTIRYLKPVHYDQLLHVTVMTGKHSGIRIEHDYQIHRDAQLIATASTTLVCVDANGKPKRMPDGIC